MGKPAARVGDLTAHGGSITLGLPTVLIGGMPAARMGDMHVCPMLTPGVPPIPHVGGPVSLGSTGVLIGGQPAARMGDMLMCVGPPDTIAMGCFTVLIGEMSPGGGGGGGAGSPAVAAAQAGAAIASSGNKESTTKEEHWVEFEFADKAGNTVSGIPYKFTDTENNDSDSNIKLDGKVRRDSLKDGDCKVQLFGVSNAKWSKDKAKIGDKVKLTAKASGFKNNTPATIEINKRDFNSPDSVILTIESKVKNGKVEEEWEYVLADPADKSDFEGNNNKKYSSPRFYFNVIINSLKTRSGLLEFKDTIEVELRDQDDNQVKNTDYIMFLSDGSIRKGKLDDNGKAKEKDVPLYDVEIIFPDLNEE